MVFVCWIFFCLIGFELVCSLVVFWKIIGILFKLRWFLIIFWVVLVMLEMIVIFCWVSVFSKFDLLIFGGFNKIILILFCKIWFCWLFFRWVCILLSMCLILGRCWCYCFFGIFLLGKLIFVLIVVKIFIKWEC